VICVNHREGVKYNLENINFIIYHVVMLLIEDCLAHMVTQSIMKKSSNNFLLEKLGFNIFYINY